MTVVRRRIGERLRIGDQVEITVVAVLGHQVHLCIKAPGSTNVWRAEEFKRDPASAKPDEAEITVLTWLEPVLPGTSGPSAD
jgi:carbon storage regulator